MANHCIICYKEVGIPHPTKQTERDVSSKSREKCKMFFKLLERYLKEPGDECIQSFPVWENIFDAGAPISCEACQGVMESFCELFHQLKSIELLINWKLWTLKNIMHSAQRVPSRLNEFKQGIMQMQLGKGSGGDGDDEQLNLILNFKRDVIKKCSTKLLTTFPLLKLVKFQVEKDESVQVPAVDDCVNIIDDGIANMTVPTQVARNNNIPLSPSITLEVEDTPIIDQDTEELVAANVYVDSINISSVPNSKKSQASSKKKNRRKVKRNLFRVQRDARLKTIRNRALANLREAIPSGGKSPSNSVNAVEEQIQIPFIDCVPESLEMRADAEVGMDGTERSLSIPPTEDLITDGEPVRHGRPETMDDSVTENTIQDLNVDVLQAETSLIISKPMQDPPSPSRTSVYEEDLQLHQGALFNSKNVKIETNPKNSSDPEVAPSIECTEASPNSEEVLGFSDLTIATGNNHDVAAELVMKLEESKPILTQEAKETETSSVSRLRSVHRCAKCLKTFSSFERLSEHQRAHEKEEFADSKSTGDEDSASEMGNSESDFNCSADEDVEDNSDSEENETLISRNERPFLANPRDLLLNGSESDDSEPEYYNEEEINVEKVVEELEQQPLQATSILESKSEAWKTDNKKDITKADSGKTGSNKNTNKCNAIDFNQTEADGLEQEPELVVSPTVKLAPTRFTDIANANVNSIPFIDSDSTSDIKREPTEPSNTSQGRITRARSRTSVKKIKYEKSTKKLQCFFCDVTRSSARDLARHEIREHSQVTENVQNSDNKGPKIGSMFFICPRPNCSFCNKSEQKYIHHFVLGHTGQSLIAKKGVICTICKWTSETNVLQIHYDTHHNLKNLTGSEVKKCVQTGCAAYFLTTLQLQSHERNIHGIDKRFTCTDCNISFKDMISLHKHHRQKHELNYVCTVEDCDKRFLTNEKLENHTKMVHGRKLQLIKCPACEKKCWGEANLQRHLKCHSSARHARTTKKEYTCTICKWNLARPNYLKLHFNTNHNLKNLTDSDVKKCGQTGCQAYFLTSMQLRTHLKKVHGIEKRFTCTDCNLTYKAAATLSYHYRRKHKHELHFVCTVEHCGNRFKTSDLLDSHTTAMHGPNMQLLKCPTCEKPIWGKSCLMQHLQSHSSVHKPPKKYICEQCGKVLKNKTMLEFHYLSHSGPASWEFQCSVCSKKCLTQQKLNEHIRTHTKEKPFVCEICGEKYAHRHNLRNHVNSKHGKVTQDKPRKFNKANLTSRKGIKRKRVEEETLSESSCNSDSND